jgi:LRR receptor-like serine/threonine-protein kinase FLS2
MVSLLSALFLFLLSLHCLVPCLAANKKNITTDESALLAFKSLITSDPNHILANNWSTSSSICNWVGVTCDERHNRVHTLNLTNMGLRGTLSPNLGNMSFLVILDLSYNSFGGQFPFKEICWLPRLKSLHVFNNEFFGEIPATLGDLSQLQSLKLGKNNFNGFIPQTISNMSSLETLSLYNNNFSGTSSSRFEYCISYL